MKTKGKVLVNQEKIRDIAGIKLNVLFIFIIAVISIAVYINSLPNGFLFDDKTIVESNPIIRDLKNIPEIFASNYWKNTPYEKEVLLYRPLVVASFSLDFAVYKNNVWGFHLTNILVHTAVCISILLFFNLLIPLFVKEKSNVSILSMIPAVLFAVHPVHTEAVNGIVGRTELLCALFFILALILALKNRILWSLIVFGLALLCKESAVTFPLILLLLYLAIPSLKKEKNIYGIFKLIIPYLCTTLFYFILRSIVLKGVFSGGQGGIFTNKPFIVMFCTMIKAAAYYIRLLFYPVGLSPDYNDFTFSLSLFEKDVFMSMIVLLCVFACLVVTYKRNKFIFLGISWFFITLLPVSNIIPIGAVLGERFLYLPSLGFCFVISGLYLQFKEVSPRVLLIMMVCVLIWFSVLTINRNRDWRDDLTLWSAAAKSHPDNVKAHYHLAEWYYARKDYMKAIEEYKKSIVFNPLHAWNPNKRSLADVHYKLGIIYQLQGNYSSALDEYMLAVQLVPDHLLAEYSCYLLRGLDLARQGSYEKAVMYYKEAAKIIPDSPELHYNLGLAYLKSEKLKDAVLSFSESIKLSPGFVNAYINLGNTYIKLNKYKDAVLCYEKALEIDKDSVIAKTNLERVKQFLEK